jgi:hypothetical protein
MYKRVEVEEPPVLMQRSPFVAEKAGTSLVIQILLPPENNVIGAPAAIAPAEAGTAVPELAVKPAVVESETPVAARLNTMLPVPVPFKVMVPAPLASTVRFSSVPDEIAETATPAAAAAPLTCNPVTTEAVEASIFKTGLLPPGDQRLGHSRPCQ